MDTTALHRFIKNTEKLVTPRAVGKLYGRAEMLGKLPVGVQKWVVNRAGGDDPYIGFVVEPYSFFLAYELADLAAAQRQLPADYELVPTAMFEGTEARPSGIIAAFNIHTSVFWGSRVEFYVIAENKKTGLLSWVICDYESNTISYDPGQGFTGSSTSHSIITTAHTGDVVVDVQSEQTGNMLAVVADLDAGTRRALDQRLWLEGNLSVDYGGRMRDEQSVPFGLVFDPGEVETALDIPLESVDLQGNTFGAGLLAEKPFEACVFPYAQHFLTTSFPATNPITTREELERAVGEQTAA